MSQQMPAWFSAVLAAVRGLLIAAGGLMIGLHYEHSEAYKLIIELAGATMIVGPLVWGVWVAGIQLYRSIAAGVQAGITMTTQGKAITDDGQIITSYDPNATPPKPVTIASAKQIVADFAPNPQEIAPR